MAPSTPTPAPSASRSSSFGYVLRISASVNPSTAPISSLSVMSMKLLAYEKSDARENLATPVTQQREMRLTLEGLCVA